MVIHLLFYLLETISLTGDLGKMGDFGVYDLSTHGGIDGQFS